MNKFEFGFAREDITPRFGAPLCGYFNPRPNTGALDRLSVKAAVFRTSGRSCAAIVSYDLCYVLASFVQSVEKVLAEKKSPLAGKVLYCATHTHTGPYTAEIFETDFTDKDYMRRLREKTVAALEDAYASLAPAELYTARTECTTLAFNRRYVMKNGKILTNPGKLNPDIVRPEGGVDHSILMMEIRQNGLPVLLITNISNHSDTVGGNFVSADWPGHTEAAIQHELGYGLPVICLMGCQGNINHFNVTTPVEQTSYAEARRIGRAYAAVILSALYQLTPVEFPGIEVASAEIEVPYRQVSDAEYAEAKAVIEANKDAVMEDGRDFTSEDIAKKHPYVLKYFAERLANCRDKANTDKRVEKLLRLAFGDKLCLVSLPCEPFVEIGLAIKAASRFPMTIVVGLGMGEVGYVGLPEHYQHGNAAYETAPDPDAVDVNVGANLLALAKTLVK